MAPRAAVVHDVKGLNAALRRVPKEASVELRKASARIAKGIADEAAGRARGVGGVAALVAPTIRAGRDRVPLVKMGGPGRLPTAGDGWERTRDGSRQTVGDVIWGAEFGGGARSTTLQFMPHKGTIGYFLWPTVRDRSDETQEAYGEALQAALEDVP
jgi:hypothetical protein